ncbi:hypothetical protein HK104_010318 [Borealophlyctis nickersoniae]|nr:hypothetical protein HK104_010318 [Borealophlyctis nickersoniae]
MLSAPDASTPAPDQQQQQQQLEDQQQEQQQQQQQQPAQHQQGQEQAQRPAIPNYMGGKGPLGKFQQAGGGFKSPTDNIMSPATQKVEAKRKQHLSNVKPQLLADRFAQSQPPNDKP